METLLEARIQQIHAWWRGQQLLQQIHAWRRGRKSTSNISFQDTVGGDLISKRCWTLLTVYQGRPKPCFERHHLGGSKWGGPDTFETVQWRLEIRCSPTG
jgi:hypothetical protein